MSNLFHTGALDEWGNEYVIKDMRKTCYICGKKTYFAKRMPVDAEPNEEGGTTVFKGNVCMDCVEGWTDILQNP